MCLKFNIYNMYRNTKYKVLAHINLAPLKHAISIFILTQALILSVVHSYTGYHFQAVIFDCCFTWTSIYINLSQRAR